MAETQVVVLMACLAALTWLRKVGSPPLQVRCDPAEFPYSGICCKRCPAGTHVEEFCTFPHTLGICKFCIDGETYTDRDNGLEHCFQCIDCKPGYKMIAPCTRKKNTECQCNDGYFCPQGCEECVKCKTQCPEGQEIMERCNATTDMKCGPPYPETSDSSFASISIGAGVSVALVVLVLVPIGSFIYFIYKRRKSSSVMNKGKEESTDNLIPDNDNINSTTEATAPPQDRLPETAERDNLEMGRREQDSVLPNRPSVSSSFEAACSNGQSSGRNDVQSSNKPAVRFNTSCMETLEKAYFQTKDIVVPNYWETLMRKCCLSENDLQSIKHDNAQHSDEQRYQMLRTLRDRNGVVPAFNRIFAGLKEMQLNGIYENLINELKSKDLIIKETED